MCFSTESLKEIAEIKFENNETKNWKNKTLFGFIETAFYFSETVFRMGLNADKINLKRCFGNRKF